MASELWTHVYVCQVDDKVRELANQIDFLATPFTESIVSAMENVCASRVVFSVLASVCAPV